MGVLAYMYVGQKPRVRPVLGEREAARPYGVP